MNLSFTFFLIIALYSKTALSLSIQNLNNSSVLNLWENFKLTHEKTYPTDTLETFRFAIFKKNLETIEKHNIDYEKGLYTYRLGTNQFADMTVEEFKEKMLGTRFNMSFNKHSSSGTFLKLSPQVEIPTAIDWRKLGAVTEVKDQGQCGSCWAFSTTGSLEAAHFRLTNKLVSLSEQQLVDCSSKYNNNGCNGGLMDNAFQYIQENHGLDTEESYPYHGKVEECHFSESNIGSTCSGFVDIESGDEKALRDALATIGPVSVAIDVTEDKFMLYKDGIFVDTECANGLDDLNHGVLVVGYGKSIGDTKKQDFWIVKNSWGTKWGENGYIRMARNVKNMCGISTRASYPLVKEKNL